MEFLLIYYCCKLMLGGDSSAVSSPKSKACSLSRILTKKQTWKNITSIGEGKMLLLKINNSVTLNLKEQQLDYMHVDRKPVRCPTSCTPTPYSGTFGPCLFWIDLFGKNSS